MRAKLISAMENAYSEGSDCASERHDHGDTSSEARAWWAQYRGKIVRDFESGAGCALCPAGTPLADFLPLWAECGRGFDETMSAAAERKQDPAKTLKRLTAQANAVAALLSAVDVLPAEDQNSILLTCSSIADDVARDLDALVGSPA